MYIFLRRDKRSNAHTYTHITYTLSEYHYFSRRDYRFVYLIAFCIIAYGMADALAPNGSAYIYIYRSASNCLPSTDESDQTIVVVDEPPPISSNMHPR